MANTAIFIEGGTVLNSEKCQDYGLQIIDIGENFNQEALHPAYHSIIRTLRGKRRLYRPSMK